jgi:tetratricopeptide (TPR) repeat protein/TolB-like protein/tRNA A-37 threonylcarbamoyl transferase component Bud32
VIGKTISQYTILRKLGSGGMGEVYAAEDGRLRRRVALKVLRADVAEDPERRMRFEREAKAVAALSHPNIVTIYAVEEADGQTFLTMEYVEGQSMSELIPDGGLPLGRYFDLAIPLCDAISSAHQKGITHRDLKPENVMISEEGRLKVLDFGLAKLREEVVPASTDLTQMETTAETQEGLILGTVAYMSPEQAQGKPVDSRSDVFSLGIILYEMATGERPFKGDNNISILSSIIKDTPVPVNEIRDGLPSPLGRIIARALEKDPDRRYGSATELRDALEKLKRDVDTGEMRVSTARVLVPERRGWIVPAAMIAGVLVLGAATVGALRLLPAADPADTEPAVEAVDSRPSLAVFYFDNITGDPELEWLRTGLTDMLVTDLSQSPDVRVLDTGRLYQILERADLLSEPKTSFKTVQAVARQADVSTAVTGSFVRSGETIRISAKLQDVDSGDILASEIVEGQGEASIFNIVDDLTRQIKDNIDVPVVAAVSSDRDLKDVTTDSLEAYRYYAEGIRLHERLKEEEALPLLEKAVEVDPDFAMALAKLSVVHGNTGDMDKAKEYAGRALEMVDHLSDRERYYIEGRYYSLAPETVDEAIAAYERAVEAFPDHGSARNNLAQLYFEVGRTEEAIAHYEDLRRRGMSFPATYSGLATAYAAVGRNEEGYDVLRDYVREYPDSAAGFRYLAWYAMTMGRYDQALEALTSSDVLDPGNFETVGMRWTIDVLSGRWEEAALLSSEALAAEKPEERWWGGTARSAEQLYAGESQAAWETIRTATDTLPPGDRLRVEGRLRVAGMLLDLGDAEGVLKEASAAVEEAGEYTELAAQGHFLLAAGLSKLGKVEESEKPAQVFREYIESLSPEYKKRYMPVTEGALAYFRGDTASMMRHFEQAKEVLPVGGKGGDDHCRIWYGLAHGHLEAGDDAKAIEYFEKIVDAGQTRLWQPILYVRSLYHLGAIYEERGEMAEALDYFRRFLALWGEGDIDRERVDEAKRKVGGALT